MLVYRKQSLQMQELLESMEYILDANSVDIVAGDLNIDLKWQEISF